ncbi:hypothetical protein KJ903_02570 [Patescibacteria group bacterium]|nr:hypothetical protein [Patescibacteria group bacterium]
MKFSGRKVLFLVLFIVLGSVALQIPLVNIVGSARKFTVLELFGPSAGMLAGPVVGTISVLAVKIISALITGASFDVASMLLLLTMPLAALYFGSKSKLVAVIPVVCMTLFIMHPIGREVWYFSLYWLIPILGVFKKKFLILNSLGSTFTAHAVGSTVFLYAFGLPAAAWVGLIPQVALERGFFAVGIWFSYLVMNNVFNLLASSWCFRFMGKLVNDKYVYFLKS